MRLKTFFLLALLCAAPSATADWGATNEGGILNYEVDSFSIAVDNPPAGVIFNRTITLAPRHDYAIDEIRGQIVFGSTIVSTNTANGVWRIQVRWDGVLIPNCYWQAETIGGLGVQTTFPFYGIYCSLTNAQMAPGTHYLVLERIIQSGSPSAITHAVQSYSFTRTDFLVPDMTNDLLEFAAVFTPLLLFAGVILWAEATKDFLVYILGAVAGLFSVIYLWNDVAAIRVVLIAATLFMAIRAYFARENNMPPLEG